MKTEAKVGDRAELKKILNKDCPFSVTLWGKRLFQTSNLMSIILLEKLGLELIPVIHVSFLGESWEINDVAQAFAREDVVAFLMEKSGKSQSEVLEAIQDFSNKYH